MKEQQEKTRRSQHGFLSEIFNCSGHSGERERSNGRKVSLRVRWFAAVPI